MARQAATSTLLSGVEERMRQGDSSTLAASRNYTDTMLAMRIGPLRNTNTPVLTTIDQILASQVDLQAQINQQSARLRVLEEERVGPRDCTEIRGNLSNIDIPRNGLASPASKLTENEALNDRPPPPPFPLERNGAFLCVSVCFLLFFFSFPFVAGSTRFIPMAI